VLQLDCVERKMHRYIVLLKDKVVTNDAIIASNICEDGTDFSTGVARHLRAARNGIVCCCVLRTA